MHLKQPRLRLPCCLVQIHPTKTNSFPHSLTFLFTVINICLPLAHHMLFSHFLNTFNPDEIYKNKSTAVFMGASRLRTRENSDSSAAINICLREISIAFPLCQPRSQILSSFCKSQNPCTSCTHENSITLLDGSPQNIWCSQHLPKSTNLKVRTSECL